MVSPLLANKGDLRGRLKPRGWTPPAGDYAMVLGSDLPGIKHKFKGDDAVRLAQTGDVTGKTTLTFQAYVRAPSELPANCTWHFEWGVNGVERGHRYVAAGYDQPVVGASIDVSQEVGDVEVYFQLRWGGATFSGVYEAEMPGVYIDAIGLVEDVGPVVLTEMIPDVGNQAALRDGPFRLGLSDVRVGGAGVDESTVWVMLDGVPIILGGTGGGSIYLQPPTTPFPQHLLFEWYPVALLASDTAYEISYYGDTLDGVHFEGSYTFRTRDETAPEVVGAQALDLKTLRIAFNEPMVEGDGTAVAGVTFAGNYLLEAFGAPAFVPTAVSAVAKSATTVDVTFDAELSPGIVYKVFVGQAEDLYGNALVAPNNAAEFTAVYPAQPLGRRFDIFDWYPELNKREDAEGTGDLAKFTACLQEIAVLLLADVDRWTEILDPDLAPEWALDAMLRDLGNPFAFDLAVIDKRRLVQLLVPLYRQKGTNPGIQNALRFFLGIEATIEQFSASGFELGEAELGTTGDLAWELGPGTVSATYSFDVRVEVFLTEVQRKQVRDIVDYMKPAWTHFVTLREPETPIVIDHLELGLSELDDQFILH